MRFKATFAIGFGLGYTLGAKAGRQRYEQISSTMRSFSESTVVQSLAGMLRGRAEELLGVAKQKVEEHLNDGGDNDGPPSRFEAPTPPYPGSVTHAVSGGLGGAPSS